MAVGLDIGSKTIKIIELDKKGSGWSLKGAGVVGYSGNSPENFTDEKELTAMSDIVRKLVNEARVSKRNVILSLPESQVSTQLIKFPLLSDKEIASAVKWEAEQHIPFPIDDAVVQHKVIERNEQKTPPEVIVLLLAAPQALVEVYMTVAKMAGLEVKAVETELVALSRSLAPLDKTVLIMDLGARSTDIGICRKGNLMFTRSIATGGEAFTRAIGQSMSMDVSQAEQYKKTYGLSQAQLEGKVKTALEPVINMVVDEVKKAIHFYKTEEKAQSPQSIILTGGGTGLNELVSVLSAKLGLEVVIGNPFSKVDLSATASKNIANYAPLYAAAVGLGIREDK